MGLLSTISDLKQTVAEKKIIHIDFESIRMNRKVIPLVDRTLDNLVVGVAMILSIEPMLLKKKLIKSKQNRYSVAPEVVISFKFNNPPKSDNPYDLGQFIRVSFAAYARQSKKTGFLLEFPIFKILNNQLRPRSQWVKYVDSSLIDDSKRQSIIDKGEMLNPREVETVRYPLKHLLVLENVDTSTLYKGSQWVSKTNPNLQVEVDSVIDGVPEKNVKFKKRNAKGLNVLNTLPISKFLSIFRYKLREGVKRKDSSVMMRQTSVYVNEIFVDCLKRTHDEYLDRYQVSLASQDEFITLIELSGSLLSQYPTVGEYAAFVAKNIIEKAIMRKN